MTHERDHQTIANLVANICVSIYSVQLSQMGLCVKYTLSYLMQHTVWSKLLGKIWHGSRNAWTGPTCPNFSLQTVWNWKVSVQSVGNSVTDQKGVFQPPHTIWCIFSIRQHIWYLGCCISYSVQGILLLTKGCCSTHTIPSVLSCYGVFGIWDDVTGILGV